MHFKTLDKSGTVSLADYSEALSFEIVTESNGYVLRRLRSWGSDYGGSQCSEHSEVTYEDIIPERILVKDGHFCGVCIYIGYDSYNGGSERHLEEVVLLADGSGVHSARSGFDFSNDDHSRWDYSDISLMDRIEAEKESGRHQG